MAGTALAGCGAGATSATKSTNSSTATGTGTGTGGGHHAREPVGQGQPVAKPTTLEEKREYDANEGRCEDDGGSVRDVGTINAYCAFPTRSDDFHLIETSHEKEPGGEEE